MDVTGLWTNRSCSDFISHSASVLQLQFLYQVALANKTSGKTILDIGSRLGAVLYSVSGWLSKTRLPKTMCQKINHSPLQGYLFSEAKKLIGVEINSWFHNVQVDTVAKYKMKDRIEVSGRLYWGERFWRGTCIHLTTFYLRLLVGSSWYSGCPTTDCSGRYYHHEQCVPILQWYRRSKANLAIHPQGNKQKAGAPYCYVTFASRPTETSWIAC